MTARARCRCCGPDGVDDDDEGEAEGDDVDGEASPKSTEGISSPCCRPVLSRDATLSERAEITW